MIDSHCHVEYTESPENTIEEAKKKMAAIINSSADLEHFQQLLNLMRKNKEFFFVTVGMHPTKITEIPLKKIEEHIEELKFLKDEIVGVGEVGLDYYHLKDKTMREESKTFFKMYIAASNELKKPLVIHSRDALKDTLEILKSAKTDVMMHCFSGNEQQLKECIDRNYFISIATIICKSKLHKDIAEKTPLENMLLETDSPWLDPESPHLINRPWKIEQSAEVIAGIKGVEKDDVLSITEKNSRRLFKS